MGCQIIIVIILGTLAVLMQIMKCIAFKVITLMKLKNLTKLMDVSNSKHILKTQEVILEILHLMFAWVIAILRTGVLITRLLKKQKQQITANQFLDKTRKIELV